MWGACHVGDGEDGRAMGAIGGGVSYPCVREYMMLAVLQTSPPLPRHPVPPPLPRILRWSYEATRRLLRALSEFPARRLRGVICIPPPLPRPALPGTTPWPSVPTRTSPPPSAATPTSWCTGCSPPPWTRSSAGSPRRRLWRSIGCLRWSCVGRCAGSFVSPPPSPTHTHSPPISPPHPLPHYPHTLHTISTQPPNNLHTTSTQLPYPGRRALQ